HSGVVAEHRDIAQSSLSLFGYVLEGTSIPHVELKEGNLAHRGPALKGRACRVQRLLVSIGDGNPSTCSNEGMRDCQPDTLSTAGDERDVLVHHAPRPASSSSLPNAARNVSTPSRIVASTSAGASFRAPKSLLVRTSLLTRAMNCLAARCGSVIRKRPEALSRASFTASA